MKNDGQIQEEGCRHQPDDIPTLDPRVQARWDAWADARIHAIVRETSDMLADVFGGESGLQEKRLMQEIKKLRHSVSKLRAEFILQHSELAAIRQTHAKAVMAKAKEIVGHRRRR